MHHRFRHSSTRICFSLVELIKTVTSVRWRTDTPPRLALVVLLTMTSVIASRFGLSTAPAYAAMQSTSATTHVMQRSQAQSQTRSMLALDPWQTSHPSFNAATAGTVNGMGIQSFYTYVRDTLNDRMNLNINVGNGNVVFHATDLQIKGTLLDLSIERYYNSESGPSTEVGTRWQLNTGANVFLHFNSDNSITFHGPSGYAAQFTPDGNGGYNDPSGLDATLFTSSDANTPYHIRFHKTGERLEFSPGGYLMRDEEQNGNGLTFAYNASHQLTSITDTQNRVVTFSYNSSGLLTTITDPSGRTVTYSYDSNGNLISSTDLAGNATSYSYTAGTNNLVQITDPLGNVTQLTYGGSGGQIRTLTDATGAVTSFTFNADDTTNVKDARGNTTTYLHDDSIRITKVTDALGHTQAKTYTPDSNVASITDPLGNVTTYSYDVNNNMTTASWPTGAKYTYAYNDSNHPFYPTTQTDPQGNTLSFTYNGNGDLTQVRDSTDGGTGSTTKYSYNANGTLASMTDPRGNQTTYSYDSAGNLIQITPPSPLGATTLTYDSLSRLSSVTDGKGQTTTYSYDALDHITGISYADGSRINYTYDSNGNVIGEVDNTGTTSFGFDAVNRLLTKTLPNGTKLSYTYDQVGNPTSFTDPGGTVTYSYDAVNLLTTLTEPGGAQTTFSYDNKDQRTATNYPNGVTITISYNGTGQETSVTAKHASTLLAGYSYNYNNTSLRQSVTDQVTNQQTNYQYDTLNRLVNAGVFNDGTKVNNDHYGYDLAGNITSQTLGLNAQQVTYTYNAANELVSDSNGANYSYDANGNLTAISSNGTTLGYNAKNQTTSINGTSQTYTGGDQTERVQAGNTSYINSPQGISSQNDSSGTTYFTRDSQGNLVSERTPGGTYYYLFDSLGSIVGLTDSGGNLVGNTRYQYDPYGNLTNTISSPVLQANPWRYTGGYFDSNSGYYKFGNRYYDPTTAHWTQPDSIAGNPHDPTTQNRCAYANGDPVNVVDPSGRSGCNLTLDDWIIIAGLTLATALLILGLFLSGPIALVIAVTVLSILAYIVAFVATARSTLHRDCPLLA